MKTYEYKCTICGAHAISETRADQLQAPCVSCGEGSIDVLGGDVVTWQRVWSFAAKPMMHEHFNNTLGEPVGDYKRFATRLREKGRQLEDQTGIPMKYEPLEYGDHAAFDATGEGIYESNRHRSRVGAPLLPEIEPT